MSRVSFLSSIIAVLPEVSVGFTQQCPIRRSFHCFHPTSPLTISTLYAYTRSQRSNKGSNVENTSRRFRTNRQSNNSSGNTSTPSAGSRTKSSLSTSLPQPDIIFQSNHLLVVNKPPGYHSQPNESLEQAAISASNTKCLLTLLKTKKLGGGSQNDFLLPMHRIDQPCSGVSVLAKQSKAGTRIGNAFRKHLTEKDYFCVVEGSLEQMIRRSVTSENKKMMPYKISGVLQKQNNKRSNNGSQRRYGGNNNKKKGGDSVIFKPLKQNSDEVDSNNERLCHIEWEHLLTTSNNLHLIRVKTSTGAKHQVRAMLSQLAHAPICGDLRYGASFPLPDKSVALHARSISFPTVKLGDLNLTKPFVARVPKTWGSFFSITEKSIK